MGYKSELELIKLMCSTDGSVPGIRGSTEFGLGDLWVHTLRTRGLRVGFHINDRNHRSQLLSRLPDPAA